MLDNHRELNELCHKMDSSRLTTLACYAMCGPFNPGSPYHRSGELEPLSGLVCAGPVPERPLDGFLPPDLPQASAGLLGIWCRGYAQPPQRTSRRGDHTEEYQAKYHEYMLKCFARHKWLWSTHVWNMFDFAADARDQGGEPGMNHKGLVTFDRKIKRTASTFTRRTGLKSLLYILQENGMPTAPNPPQRSPCTPTSPPLRCMSTAS